MQGSETFKQPIHFINSANFSFPGRGRRETVCSSITTICSNWWLLRDWSEALAGVRTGWEPSVYPLHERDLSSSCSAATNIKSSGTMGTNSPLGKKAQKYGQTKVTRKLWVYFLQARVISSLPVKVARFF